MNEQQRDQRRRRIAEIASEIAGTEVTPDVVKAVDDARRAEYYQRLEEAGLSRKEARRGC